MGDGEATNVQFVATVLAWSLVFIIVALLVLVVAKRRRAPTINEFLTALLGAFVISISGAMTAALTLFPNGTFDLELFRYLFLIGPRATGTVLFLGLLLARVGWEPPVFRRFL